MNRRPLRSLALPPLPGRLTATAWALPAKLSYSDYETLCRGFGGGARGLTNTLQWAAGDLIGYGERLYGERAYQALEFLGFDERTLSNYARVASVFPPARRRALPLSHAHHAVVAALHPEEQDEWLDRALKDGWTRAELRKALQERAGGASGSSPSGPGSPPKALEVWKRLRETLDIVKAAREKFDRFPDHVWTTGEVKDLIVSLEQALFVEG